MTCCWPDCTEAAAGDFCPFHAPQWRGLASCRGSDLEFWFSTDVQVVDQAKQVCASCPVSELCKADVLAVEAGLPLKMRHGVRGGLDPAERVAAAGQRARMTSS